MRDRDFTGKAFLYWKLPAILMVAVAVLDIDAAVQASVWAPCLVVFAAACLANAISCGRIHCYFTAPFFLVMAVVSAVYGLGALRLGPSGWNWIELATVVGAAVLTYLPEVVWGRYRARTGDFA